MKKRLVLLTILSTIGLGQILTGIRKKSMQWKEGTTIL